MNATCDPGTLFIISGPSGVGKGTLKEMLLSEFKEHAAFSVSATTRKARPSEIEGKDYFFLDRAVFEQRIDAGEFLEHAEYAGNLYGTPRPWVERLLEQGTDVILEIDVQGAQQVMQNKPDCVSVFILPPSMGELEARLRGRGTESEEKIMRRLAAAKHEMAFAEQYDQRIINDDLENAYARLRQIYLKQAGFMKSTRNNPINKK